ncbi:MAG: pyridoxal phosphate-dependent aminotransferase [Clostridia bacterium]|nr:pyridoxal phosphate-dependent aminotransferase [Clostridia bacterium]MBO7289763.1 pyridoxal phosphate-dependent aminotransferase [Clostridia bacterium]
MVSQKMYELGSRRSEIRELFEYGLKRKAEIGAENVYDFSLGNPSVPAPECVKEALADLVLNTDPVALHGYTSAQGAPDVRKACADYVNANFGTKYTADNFYMTVGAAASLTISLSAIAQDSGEVIILAPFFPEYIVFINQAGMTPVTVKCREEDFQIDFDALKKAINKNTKAIIINSPNNPSGVVFSEATIKKLASVLNDAQKELGKDIYIIADEPYRELVYTQGVEVPFIPNYYNNTIVCYSFSKSLSLPGERIGYVLVPNTANKWQDVYFAVCGAGRSLGFVCAPSLFQKIVPKCIGKTADISIYKKNRDILCDALSKYGYKVAQPDGAFYLFVKALEEDSHAFCEKAKKYELLLVPGDSFGYPGYVRISYCVSTEMIEKSLPSFEALSKEYK